MALAAACSPADQSAGQAPAATSACRPPAPFTIRHPAWAASARTAGFDGFRCDVAGLVPTDFWNATRAELEKTKPVFMLAEWDELHDPPFLPKGTFTPHTHLLEKAFDATYALKLHYLLDSITQGKKPAAALPPYFATERRMYPAGVYLMNFTSSHDVNSWDNPEDVRLGQDALPLAVLTTLLPGIPLVYSGQEAASTKKLRFFDKDTIRWGSYARAPFYTTLLQLKKNSPAARKSQAPPRYPNDYARRPYAKASLPNNGRVRPPLLWTTASPCATPSGRPTLLFTK